MSSIVQIVPETGSLLIRAYLLSQTPGRIRLRIAPSHRQQQEIERITKALKESLAMYRVRSNVESGSITIFYAKEHTNFEGVCATLRGLGVVLSDSAEEPSNTTNGRSEVAANIANTVTGLNRQVKQVTRGTVDLRFLVPLGFSVLSVRQLLSKGLSLEDMPWYVLAWYSFDSFIKLNYTSDPESQSNS